MAPEHPSPSVVKYFLLLFFASILLLGQLLWPFLSLLIISFLLAGMFQPIYKYLNRWLTDTFASLLTCILIVILVFVPLTFFVGALSKEALDLYQFGKSAAIGTNIRELLQNSEQMSKVQDFMAGYGITLDPNGFNETLSEFVKTLGLFLYKQASSWAANVMNFVFRFFLMILIIFFLLIDHGRLTEFILRLSPLPDNQERRLIKKFEEISGAILVGNGICGVIQGIVGGITFTLLGLGSPILWGGVMGILAFLPIFGIGLVMGPAALILMLNGRIGAGIFMIILYVVISFSIEYLLKPKLVGKQVKMPTLLVFLAILGGLSVYGVLGIIYGPLVVTAFLTLSDIYLTNYDQYVKKGV